MEYNKTINSHRLLRADVSAEAQAIIDGTPDPVHTLDEVKDQTMAMVERDYTYVPDINGIYTYQVNVNYDSATVWAICKIRGFKKAELSAGWYVGVISPNEYGQLLLADIEERDDVMLSFFDFATEPEAAIKWVTHF